MNQHFEYIPFNNRVETGLRVLTILLEAYPVSIDKHKILCLDYLSTHSKEFGDTNDSLHISVPYQKREIYVRNKIIERGLELLVFQNLAEKMFVSSGIEYRASENSAYFLDCLSEEYTIELRTRVKWVIENHIHMTTENLKELIKDNENLEHEFNLQLLE